MAAAVSPVPADLAAAERALAAVPCVGYTVFWRLAGARIRHADFAARLGAAGFKWADPGPPSARVALRRALEWWRARYITALGVGVGGETGDETAARVRIVDIAARGDELVYGVVRESRSAARKAVRHTTELRVFVDQQTRALAVTTGREGDYDPAFAADDVRDQIAPYWEYAQAALESGDLSDAILRVVVRLDSVRLRPEGGVYFVPHTRRDDLTLLKQLVETLPGGRCVLGALGIPDLPAYKASAQASIHEGLLADLEEAERDLAAAGSSLPEVSVAARLKEYRKLKAKVSVYADALGLRVEQVQRRLDALTRKVEDLA